MLLNSCKKEKGDIGPMGPQGLPGTNGSANISSSNVLVDTWTYDAVNKRYYYDHFDLRITQEVVDGGMVMVYLVSGENSVALPVTIYPATTYSETISFLYNLLDVEIRIQDSDLTQPANPGTLTFKVVVIPPSMIKPEVNHNNYASVKYSYNLQD